MQRCKLRTMALIRTSPAIAIAVLSALTAVRLDADDHALVDATLNEEAPPLMDSPEGGGVFGRWTVDEQGQPAYEYTMNQTTDPRAEYRTSAGPSRDHWHLVGNDRVIATAHNGGYVQLYDWARGGKVLNRWDAGRGHYSGGFTFVTLNGEPFCTRWDALPAGSEQRRVFGEGHFEKRTRYQGVEIV